MEMKLPVFPNWYPYNEMVFDGHLQVGDFAVKTRSWNWNYRGPVLFYTSGRVAQQAIDAYKYQKGPFNHKSIIGIADLVETRLLTNREAKKMVCNFNNWTPRTLNQVLKFYDLLDDPFRVNEHGFIAPFRIGFFFKNAKRFKEPVPFNWPAGPVRPITIHTARYPKLHAQILMAQ